jgi:uncharacterized protein (DUF2141 family)
MRFSWLMFIAAIVCSTRLAGAQLVFLPGQPRDPRAASSTERRVPVGTAVISGVVTASDTGGPVAGARVLVNGAAICNEATPGTRPVQIPLNRVTVTDANGEFSFARLPAGVFQISVEANDAGLLDVEYGQRRPGGDGQFIRLADAQTLTLSIPMVRGAVIAGTVFGPNGRPLVGTRVSAARYVMRNGARHLEMNDQTETDDRGMYRIFGLEPGAYLIAVHSEMPFVMDRRHDGEDIERAIRMGRIMPSTRGMPAMIQVPAESTTDADVRPPSGYLPTYAPGVLTPAEATTITVAGNEERTGIDIRALLVPATEIEGAITTPLDANVGTQLWLLTDSSSVMDYSRSTMAEKDGTFSFSNVAPGTYTVFAQTMAQDRVIRRADGSVFAPAVALTDSQKMWGRAHVVVTGAPLVRMSLSLEPSRSISGVVIFDMPQRPDLTRTTVTVRTQSPSRQGDWRPAGSVWATVAADGRFTITGVPAGRYTLQLDGPWTLKSAMVANQDTLDFPLVFSGEQDVTDAVLTVTDRRSELTGMLTDAAGKPALDYQVIVAATDSKFWCLGMERRVRMTSPDIDGYFAFNALPPGSYQIAVVIDPDPDAVNDPEFLRTVMRTSIQVTIGEGAKVTQNLRVR